VTSRTVALLVHHERPEAASVASSVLAALLDAGHRVRLPTEDASVVGVPEAAVPEASLAAGGLDLAVAVGGDGTMLRTVALVAEAGVPVLGINVGQLGYLTEVEPADALAAVEKVLAGDHGVEDRMLVSVRVVAIRYLVYMSDVEFK
jgi:NAD+ kinase